MYFSDKQLHKKINFSIPEIIFNQMQNSLI